LAAEIGELLEIDLAAELGEEVVAQGGEVPGVGVLVVGAVTVDVLFDDDLHHVHHTLLLFDAFKQLAAQSIDGLALLVVDVVVFEQVFAGFEILGFDGLLGFADPVGDHFGFDGDIFFHAEAEHEVLHFLAAENAQQVVLEGEEETGGAGIALAAGASAKLVVDAAGFMALSGDDVEAAEAHHFVMFGVGELLVGGEDLVPHVAAHAIELLVVGEVVEVLVGNELGIFLGQALSDLFLEALVLGHELGVAAEQDVGTAAGHVGGDGNGVLAAGLGDNAGFAFVILGVEDLVLHPHLLEDGGEAFALLD